MYNGARALSDHRLIGVLSTTSRIACCKKTCGQPKFARSMVPEGPVVEMRSEIATKLVAQRKIISHSFFVNATCHVRYMIKPPLNVMTAMYTIGNIDTMTVY